MREDWRALAPYRDYPEVKAHLARVLAAFVTIANKHQIELVFDSAFDLPDIRKK